MRDRFAWEHIKKYGRLAALTITLGIGAILYSGCGSSIDIVETAEAYQFQLNHMQGLNPTKRKKELNELLEKEFEEAYKSKDVTSKDFEKAQNIVITDIPAPLKTKLSGWKLQHGRMMDYYDSANQFDSLIENAKGKEKSELLEKKITNLLAAESSVPEDQFNDELKNSSSRLANLYAILESKEQDPAQKKIYSDKKTIYVNIAKHHDPEFVVVASENKKPETKTVETKTDETKPIVAKDQSNSTPLKGNVEVSSFYGGEKTTRNNGTMASFFSDIFNFRGVNKYSSWNSLNGESINEIQNSAHAQAKVIGTLKLFGINVPDEFSDFLEISASYDNNEKRERMFTSETTADADYSTQTDTAIKNIIKTDYFSAFAGLKLLGFGIDTIGFQKTEKITSEVTNGIYVTDSHDPAGNYAFPLFSSTTDEIKEAGVQLVLRYLFEKEFEKDEDKITFKGDIGLLGDHTDSTRTSAGNKEKLRNTLVGLVSKGSFNDYLGFNFMVLQEFFDGPGKADDGAKNRCAYGAVFARTPYYEVKDENDKVTDKMAGAFWIHGGVTLEKFAAGGGGFAIGSGKLDTNYISNMLNHFGKSFLGINRRYGERLGDLEIERLYRNLPVRFNNGFCLFASGWAFNTRDEDNNEVIGISAQAGTSIGPVALTVNYFDDHIVRKIGSFAYGDFNWMKVFLGVTHTRDKTKVDKSLEGLVGMEIPFG